MIKNIKPILLFFLLSYQVVSAQLYKKKDVSNLERVIFIGDIHRTKEPLLLAKLLADSLEKKAKKSHLF